MELKNYQGECLAVLERFFRLSGKEGAKRAFMELTERPYKSVKHFPDLPYVCLRVPTGGGKTLMAAHAVGITAREYLHAETAVCLWLVPTNTIRDQTLAALRNRSHPYRQALAGRFAGSVSVMDLTEALYVQAGTLSGETVVIVSTLAALRVEDTDGRKVYESAGALQHHFTQVPDALRPLLEPNDDGTISYSLANVLRLHRPVVVMDEAHNARTPLSFDTLARFQPSCVIEFTATPETTHDPDAGKFASNILCHISAAELKLEEMVKLPILLETKPDWREVVADAVAKREELEGVAAREENTTGEYIRPIMLLQAQAQSRTKETITAETLRKHLMEECKIPEDRIAVATGTTRGIDDVDLSARGCPIRFIITVQALKEGWDCPFAYVFCSVAEVGSTRAVEQLLGRVLRMPGARRKASEELNTAYAFIASQRFIDAAHSLRDALVENGFEKIEAKNLLVQAAGPEPSLSSGADLFGDASEVIAEKPKLNKLPESLRGRVIYDGESKTLSLTGPVSAEDAKLLEDAFNTPAAKEAVQRICSAAKGKRKDSPKGKFAVPMLSIRDKLGDRRLFEDQHLEREWRLSECDCTLDESEYPNEVAGGQAGQVDVTATGRVTIDFVDNIRRHLSLFGVEPGWDLPGLSNWIDRSIKHNDILPADARLFILNALKRLAETRKLATEQLARQKYRLRDAIEQKIESHRKAENGKSYQQLLFDSGRVLVDDSSEFCFEFDEGRYSPNWYYEGAYTFRKHFVDVVGELKSDGEEYECAVLIDQMDEVKYWVRNLERKRQSSFWFPTATDYFYPDFVAYLKDDRILVVEYKGSDRWGNPDSTEKRNIGALWQSASKGKCIFIMPNGPDWNAIRQAIA